MYDHWRRRSLCADGTEGGPCGSREAGGGTARRYRNQAGGVGNHLIILALEPQSKEVSGIPGGENDKKAKQILFSSRDL
jgi:hypothetical protein